MILLTYPAGMGMNKGVSGMDNILYKLSYVPNPISDNLTL